MGSRIHGGRLWGSAKARLSERAKSTTAVDTLPGRSRRRLLACMQGMLAKVPDPDRVMRGVELVLQRHHVMQWHHVAMHFPPLKMA